MVSACLLLSGMAVQAASSTVKASQIAAPKKVAYEIKGKPGVELSGDGEILGVRCGNAKQAVSGSLGLAGFHTEDKVAPKKLKGGGMSFTRTVTDGSGGHCRITERFVPVRDAVRWEVEFDGGLQPWTAPIVTRLTFGSPNELRIWTAWSDPAGRADAWRDPLLDLPFFDARWNYGNTAQIAPFGGDFVSLPLVSVLNPAKDSGCSLVLCPEDVLLHMTLGISRAGEVRWTRINHRLGGGKILRLEMHLVAHEADFRGGLRWMTAHYPALFDPPNPRAHLMAGCAAYSGDERPVDVEKFRNMSFKINWKLSDDFAYMGMFIPPVKSPEERWRRSCDETAPPGKDETSSCAQQNAYGRWMKQNGFHLLNYFNVTEFGKKMKDHEVAASMVNDPELWKDPVAFAKLSFPGGICHPQPPDMYYGAWLVDVGDPKFRSHMLEQARRHITLLPDTEGICIDRMDWLRYYNEDADDGVSWVNGKPARSMFRSWINFLEELGPIMHKADKVIFGNTMTMRLELNRHLDGIYTEHGNNPGALNAAALMGLRKPVLAWTVEEALQQPDPDLFFQRNIYMGVYPTAPYPGNHHCIQPDAKAEKWYLDYGKLMDAMRGKKWVLTPHPVSSSTPGVKVNLFEVPGGYALPVVFGESATNASVKLNNIPGLRHAAFKAVLPGAPEPVPVESIVRRGITELCVPLQRGCAMVLIVCPDTK